MTIHNYRKPFVMAEIGCNHKGNMKIAEEMIVTAAKVCKSDGVKFQKRNPKELLDNIQYNSPHPNPHNSYGSTYGEHREYLEFSLQEHRELKSICEDNNIIYSTSVWDLTSAKEIISLNPEQIKIPSACNLNKELLTEVCNSYGGEIHLSFGMTTVKEEIKIIELFTKLNKEKDLIIYSCTSGYPVPFKDISLLEINRLKNSYGSVVKSIGFSGHHLGIAIDLSAYTLGAEYIERHYTLNRTWKGTDHAASLEPEGLRKLVRDLNAVFESLTEKELEILEIEKAQRTKLKEKQIKWEKI